MTRLAIASLAALFLAIPTASSAQLNRGDQVRVELSDGGKITGTVVSTTDNVLTLLPMDGGNDVDVSLGEVRRLQVWERRSSGEGFLAKGGQGFLGGFAFGAVLGFAVGSDTGPSETRRENAAMAAGMWFGVTAGMVGGVIGLVFPGETWTDVGRDLTPYAAVQPGQPLRLGVRLRF